jgi:hypothetical protein
MRPTTAVCQHTSPHLPQCKVTTMAEAAEASCRPAPAVLVTLDTLAEHITQCTPDPAPLFPTGAGFPYCVLSLLITYTRLLPGQPAHRLAALVHESAGVRAGQPSRRRAHPWAKVQAVPLGLCNCYTTNTVRSTHLPSELHDCAKEDTCQTSLPNWCHTVQSLTKRHIHPLRSPEGHTQPCPQVSSPSQAVLDQNLASL